MNRFCFHIILVHSQGIQQPIRIRNVSRVKAVERCFANHFRDLLIRLSPFSCHRRGVNDSTSFCQILCMVKNGHILDSFLLSGCKIVLKIELFVTDCEILMRLPCNFPWHGVEFQQKFAYFIRSSDTDQIFLLMKLNFAYSAFIRTYAKSIINCSQLSHSDHFL